MNLATFTKFTAIIKYCHWSTTSYQQHKTLDDLNKSITKLIDEFVEVYSGIHDPEYTITSLYDFKADKTISTERIPDIIKFNGEAFVKILRKLSEGSDSLNSIVDSMEVELDKAQYLFRLN